MKPDITRIQNVKQGNRSTILKLIKQNEVISRADIAKQTGLTRSGVGTIVSDLIKLGYVWDIGEGESSGGKKPILVGIRRNSAYAIGVELADASHIRGVLCNLNGDIVHRKEIPYKNQFPDILEKTVSVVDDLQARVPKRHVKGIGISASAIVDHSIQEITRSSHFDIAGKGLIRLLAERFALPVFLEADAYAAAIAEKQFGIGAPYDNLLYFNVERGIGLGIIIDSKIYYGGFDGAGEIGRTIIYPEPMRVDYPPSSYLENRLSEQSIVEAVQRVKRAEIPYRKIIRMMREGDEEIRILFNQLAEYLAYAVGTIANAFNPEAIILGGRVDDFGEMFLSYFKNRLYHILEPHFIDKTRILLSKFGHDAPAFGGAVVVINKIFDLEL
jgi:N-acetylglucosamine repressor